MTMPGPADRLHFPRLGLASKILGLFESGLQPSVTIFAPRRKGKTTFVARDLMPLARQREYHVAFADLWLEKDNPERAIANALGESIMGASFVRRNLMRFSRSAPVLKSLKASAGPEGVSAGAELAQAHEQDLIELFRQFRSLGKGKALLIIDEVQHLASRKEFEALTAKLRALLQEPGEPVYTVFTGSSRDGLARMFRRTKAPFYQFSHEIAFPELGKEFVEHYARLYLESRGQPWDVEAAFERYVARGQMPMYLRQLYTMCVSESKTISQADEAVWRRFMDEGQFESLMQGLPALDQAVLVGILTRENLFSAEFRTHLADVLPSRMVPSPQTIQAALKRLQKQELVANVEHGTWVIEDSALESHLRQALIGQEMPES